MDEESVPKHLENIEPCPFLPQVDEPLRAAAMKQFGKAERGPVFYEQALKCAQSLWLQGLPAQAMLQMNRAFGADLEIEDPILDQYPLPFQAMAWVMKNRLPDQFIGNPRRHFQHFATRMNEPHLEQRTWRAWGCWWLACLIFSESEFPDDEQQIAEEGLVLPKFESIKAGLDRFGLKGEAETWMLAVEPQIDS